MATRRDQVLVRNVCKYFFSLIYGPYDNCHKLFAFFAAVAATVTKVVHQFIPNLTFWFCFLVRNDLMKTILMAIVHGICLNVRLPIVQKVTI